ncbi:MAG TPA: CBS domain-containing protein [Thermodesulforhabdus norvegica]|uniref:CBS domain-containing protein n=1 Tax=Thermodesulforhabdus norvegica TaxID=39841 RepID=A0A7C0WUB3_9BACT|nr:CBS domain-containing protein [Thermodesulforhabdus norvegica]
MKVSEFMTKKIECINADASIYDAIERLLDKRIRSLVVKNANSHKPDGVITARDIVFKVLSEGRDPRRIKVGEIASFPVVCVSPDDEISKAMRLMKEMNYARVFVCEGNCVIGVLALMDVMQASLVEKARAGNHA